MKKRRRVRKTTLHASTRDGKGRARETTPQIWARSRDARSEATRRWPPFAIVGLSRLHICWSPDLGRGVVKRARVLADIANPAGSSCPCRVGEGEGAEGVRQGGRARSGGARVRFPERSAGKAHPGQVLPPCFPPGPMRRRHVSPSSVRGTRADAGFVARVIFNAPHCRRPAADESPRQSSRRDAAECTTQGARRRRFHGQTSFSTCRGCRGQISLSTRRRCRGPPVRPAARALRARRPILRFAGAPPVFRPSVPHG